MVLYAHGILVKFKLQLLQIVCEEVHGSNRLALVAIHDLNLAARYCDELLVGKNGVDGVYTADPRKNPDAQRLDQLTYERALADGLQVVDASAFALCRDNGLTMRVFGMGEPGNITRALLGEKIGTLVTAV